MAPVFVDRPLVSKYHQWNGKHHTKYLDYDYDTPCRAAALSLRSILYLSMINPDGFLLAENNCLYIQSKLLWTSTTSSSSV